MAAYQSELAVITKAKDLCSYVMTVTDKSPKRFRFTLVAKLLGYMAQLSMEQGCILPKQYEQITKKVHDCQNMLGAWLNSDRKRLGI